MKRVVFIISIICGLTLFVIHLCGYTIIDKSSEHLVIRIANMDKLNEEQLHTLTQDCLARQQIIEGALINQVCVNQTNLAGFYAAYLLGELRSVRAIPILAEKITTENPAKHITLCGDMPMELALKTIGSPAIPAMLKNIETSPIINRCYACPDVLSASVIEYIVGAEITSFMIDSEIRKTTNVVALTNLKALAELMRREIDTKASHYGNFSREVSNSLANVIKEKETASSPASQPR